MTRSSNGSTPESMRHRLLLLATLLGFSLGCDGAYVLGDTTNVAGSGGDGGRGSDASEAGVANTLAGAAGSGESAAGAAGAGGNAVDGIRISPSGLPEARLNRSYLVQFAANGGVEPYSFSLPDGALPAGLELDGQGRLSGAPSVAGQFDFTLQVEDAEGAQATATFGLSVARSRWLASLTFPASASTQTLLSLTDLHDPDPEPESILIESQSAHVASFSPDGRWLTYYSFRSLAEVDWYIVDTAGAAPSQRQFLLTNKANVYCSWAPDSSKIACSKQTAEARSLVYFDVGGGRASPGPEVTLGTADRLAFVDADNLIFADGDDGQYSRVVWNGNVPSPAEPIGLSAVTIQRQSPDGDRAIVAGSTSVGQSLVDLKTGEATPLPQDRALLISDSFDSAVSVEPSKVDPNVARYSFYAVNGVEWTLVGEETGTLNSRYGQVLPLQNDRMTLVQGSEVRVAEIGAAGVATQLVPGDYSEVRRVEQSSDGVWLYIESGVRAENQQFLPANARHWLTRVGSAEPAQLLGEEFLGGTAAFAPDDQRFFLHGSDSYSKDVVPFLLLDLTDPDQPQPHTLDIPLNWADSEWSDDGSFIWFIGGSPPRASRPLFVVDALDPSAAPRTIFECFSNPAPLPGCPISATFQP
jgi:hypothetical protein